MNDIGSHPTISHTSADVLHIGYPKSASTFVGQFLKNHPEVTTDHNCLAELLLPHTIPDRYVIAEKTDPNKIHVSRDESITESVCVIGELSNWQRHLYIPGAWDCVKSDILVDPAEVAARLHRVHPRAKVLMLIREQVDWLQSAYKFVISQLPANQRSFADYCTTPSGIVFLKAGHFDQTIGAYIDIFGHRQVGVLRFEDIVAAPSRFASELCAFVGISERPIPQNRANETHAFMTKIQRLLPVIERLPRSVKDAVKPRAMRILPWGRAPIFSSNDIRLLRSMYAVSNQRTERLIALLSGSVG